MKCIDCKHLNLRAAEAAARGYGRLGMGKCDMKSHGTATFITATYARKCELFDKASEETVLKRIEWMEAKHAA